MMNFMKRYEQSKKIVGAIIAVMILTIAVPGTNVEAASFSVSGPGSVAPNETFTVSFGGGTTGQYSFSVSGGSLVSGPGWVEGGGSLTVAAGGSGTVTVTVTATNATTSDYQDIPPGTSKSVSVAINAPAAPSTPAAPSGGSSTPAPAAPSEPADTRSSDNKLKQLFIEGVELSPEFSSGETNYTAVVWDVPTINVSATKNDSKATVSGTGEKDLALGDNEIVVTVTAENGQKRNYTIVVTLNEAPTIFFDYNGMELGVVKNIQGVEGFTSFDPIEFEINGEKFMGWYSTQLDMNMLYLIDGEEQTGFYIYEDEQIASRIQAITIDEKNYYVFELKQDEQAREGFVYEDITVAGTVIKGWGYESEALANYKIFNLMDETGVSTEYLYSVSEDRFIANPSLAAITANEYEAFLVEQQADKASIDELSTENASKQTRIQELESLVNTLMIVSIVLGVLLVATVVTLIIKLRKRQMPAIEGEEVATETEVETSEEVGVEENEEVTAETEIETVASEETGTEPEAEVSKETDMATEEEAKEDSK